jgi:hypothetical protein
VFAVTGGGLSETGNAWIITPMLVDGKKIGDIYNRDHSTGNFVGKNFAMVEHIRNLRNQKVKELMEQLSAGDDPNNDDAQIDGTLSKPKRELVDRLPKILTITVTTASVVASVNVLPAWRDKGVLQLEITQPNLELLLEEPPADATPWTPEIQSACLSWRKSTNTLWCKYWDSRSSKYRTKGTELEFGSEMNGEAKQRLVDQAARELGEFHYMRHSEDDDMPAADDKTSEAGGDNPVRKAMKTDGEETDEVATE